MQHDFKVDVNENAPVWKLQLEEKFRVGKWLSSGLSSLISTINYDKPSSKALKPVYV